ncbi:DUF2795 domain-containing protein [Streptomyces sp. ISL-10]|uniref:DUF2795 domain-containing protein n=1 Tax=Streptomyces sp. ISL-10 TaxID=2819172 RepID=UPI001BE7F91F|nr:DUF2795 domain-containing protein [Streptomyces sp. ISL-10]MBT2365558.1 DUF2795 domain-containing protein [Streptomyces sp. ISL-10]
MNSMERGSNQVSPREDDELKHELEGYLRSGQHTHVEEVHDPEPAADDDIAVRPGGPVPPPGEARDQAEAKAEADALRLEFARHLDRTAFPADRSALVRALEEKHAPGPLLAEAQKLPKGGTYHNADEIVRALGRRPTN